MNTIAINELSPSLAALLQTIQREGQEYILTLQGKPVAILRPFKHSHMERQLAELATMQSLAQQIAQAWLSPQTSLEILEEMRA